LSIYATTLTVPIYNFRYRFYLADSVQEAVDDLKDKYGINFTVSDDCGGVVYAYQTDDWSSIVALPKNCPTKAILHEAIHIYADLIRIRGLDGKIDSPGEENHAYLLSFIQTQLIDAVLEAKEVLKEETEKSKKKTRKKKK
jgi:hypothetical protein